MSVRQHCKPIPVRKNLIGRNTIKKLSLTLVLAALGTAHAAEKPVHVATTDAGDKTYVYASTVEIRGDARAIWTLTSYKTPVNGANSDKAHVVVNCTDKMFGYTTMTYYSGSDGTGRAVHTNDRGSKMRRVVPNTPADFLLQAVCQP